MSNENLEQSTTMQPLAEGTESHTSEPLGEPTPNIVSPTAKSRRLPLPAILVTILLLAGAIGWLALKLLHPTGQTSQGPRATPVKTQAVKSATIEDNSDYVASLQSRQSVTLQPRVSGQVSAIYVRAGAPVEAGQTVLQIDPAQQQAAVASQVAAVETSRAEVETARADAQNARDTLKSLQASRESKLADLRFNQQEYQRYNDLYKQGATTKEAADQKLNGLQSAQANVSQIDADIRAQEALIARAGSTIDRSQRSLQQAQSGVTQQQVQLDYYTITAPFQGTVGDIPIKVGDFVSTTTQLLSITQNRELEIQIAVPIENAPKLRRGMPVQLLDAQNKPLLTGRVFFISPDVDPQTQSVQVKASFDNSRNKLRTQQFVRARIIWGQHPGGLLVPVTGISRLAGENFVFVAEPYANQCKAEGEKQGTKTPLKDDQLVVSQRPVQLGRVIGNEQEILSGLKPDAQIVVDGILQLSNCAPIAVSN